MTSTRKATGARPAAKTVGRPTDWRKRFAAKKDPKVVVLESDFAGIKAGSRLFVATPGVIANYVQRIPAGQTRSIERLRNELARKHGAAATCPVTTAIFLRVVAEAAWDDLLAGAAPSAVVPFWRVIEPGSPIARRLRCDSRWIEVQRAVEAQGG